MHIMINIGELCHGPLDLYVLDVELGDVVTDPHVFPDFGHNLATLGAHVPPLVVNPLHVKPDIALLAERLATLGTGIPLRIRVNLTDMR